MPYGATSSVDGTFALSDLALGTYVVSAGGPTVTVTVTGSEPVHVELSAP